ncbi:hypothetical protein OKW24_001989 [Peribacillus simplex]|nr:hypothetical protein [Peribacillus simplex]
MKKSSLLNFLAGPVCRQKGFGMVTFRNLFDFLLDLKQLERIVTQRIPCFSFASAETLLVFELSGITGSTRGSKI